MQIQAGEPIAPSNAPPVQRGAATCQDLWEHFDEFYGLLSPPAALEACHQNEASRASDRLNPATGGVVPRDLSAKQG